MRFSSFLTIIFLLQLTLAGISGDYQMVRVYIQSQSDIDNIAKLGIDLEGSRYKQDTFIEVQVSLSEKKKIENAGYHTEMLIDDLERFYASRLETRAGEGFGYGSMGGNYTFTEVLANLDSMITEYPQLISQKDTIGQSILGKPIVAVKISDNPNIQENEPEVLYTGLHHAREPGSMMTIVYYMWWLLENYGINPQATFLAENRQMWFVPVVNPDGYVHNQQTNPNGGGMWRLNARDNNNNGIYFEAGEDGVDLNRNYGYQWGYNNSGSSPYPGDETYRGPFAFSEVETNTIRNFCNQHQFKTAFNYHTYSNLLIHPWAYNDSPTPDHNLFHTFGVDMTQFNGYTLGTPGQTVGYSVNGDSNDWMYGEQASKPKILAYTPEVGNSGDGFWPATNRIIPLAQENLYPNIVLSYIAGTFPKIYDKNLFVYGFNNYIDPGEVVEVTPSMTNFGLITSNPVTAQLLPVSTQLQIMNDQVSFPSMNTFDSLTAVNPWKFKVNYSSIVGSELNFQILIFENGNLVNADSLSIPIGTYETAYLADAESGMGQLTTGGSGGTWGITANSSHSPGHSFTDSPAGNYNNNADYWMRTPMINLSNAQRATLRYWTKWYIEASWDFGMVEISTDNGTSWNHLIGQYMTPASGQGVQTTGLYGYDGTQSNWVQETIDLSMYHGQQIQIRFRFASDTWVTEDGWYIDDIQLEILDVNANIPPYISSVTPLGVQQFTGSSYPVEAVIYDDHGLDHASLFYSVDAGSSFSEIPMIGTDSIYTGQIPPLSTGTTVQYYVQAWDTAGASSVSPYNGSYYTFNIIGNTAVILVQPTQLDFTLPQNLSQELPLMIFNPGTETATYTLTDTIINTAFTQMTKQNSDYPVSILASFIKNAIFKNLVKSKHTLQSTEKYSGTKTELIPTIVITDPAGDVTLPGVDILSVDYAEDLFNYVVTMSFSGPPDTNSIGIVAFDMDQNFGTGAYPAPSGYGIGNFDIGSEYEVFFDFANFIGDSLGLPPSIFVLDVRDSIIVPVGLPIPIQFSTNAATALLPKFLFSIFDDEMNMGATMLPLNGISLPDLAPDFGHGNLGGELGGSWITEFDGGGMSLYPLSGSLNPGDTTILSIKVAAAYPIGSYSGLLSIENNGPTSPVEVPITMQITPPGIPHIIIDPTIIQDSIPLNAGLQNFNLNITNSGSGILVFTVFDSLYNGQNWLTIGTTIGSLQSGESQDIPITVDPASLSPNTLYEAELKILSNDPNTPELTVPVEIFISSPSGLVKNDQTPTQLALYRNYPNPFNPTTTISFDLPRSMKVQLEIFNILGQKVFTLVNENLMPGSYQYIWYSRNEKNQPLPSGIYFYQLIAGQQRIIKKMLLAK